MKISEVKYEFLLPCRMKSSEHVQVQYCLLAGASASQSELNSHIRVNTGHATALFTSTGDKLPNEIKTLTIKSHLQVRKAWRSFCNVDIFVEIDF